MANDVTIVRAVLEQNSGGKWRATVTLLHEDAGWEHYADGWRIVSSTGDVLGTRTLYHPHENEQPFTRNLSGIEIPKKCDRYTY